MDVDRAVAIVTREGAEDGVDVVPVAEVDGVLVDRRDGSELDLVSVVVVLGLPELESSAA